MMDTGCRSARCARTKNVNQSNSEKMRAAAEVQSEPPPPLSVARGVARRGRLLVLEDEVSLARAILRWLRDYDAVHCAGLGEALKRIRAGERFDAVLCDVMMPGGNAPDVYAAFLREAPELAEQTLFMTGGATTAETIAFVAEHSARVLCKPLDLGELRRRVGAVVNARGALREE
jgi:two-component system NtrC family sensor kinase